MRVWPRRIYWWISEQDMLWRQLRMEDEITPIGLG
jgi:hypothetical protein